MKFGGDDGRPASTLRATLCVGCNPAAPTIWGAERERGQDDVPPVERVRRAPMRSRLKSEGPGDRPFVRYEVAVSDRCQRRPASLKSSAARALSRSSRSSSKMRAASAWAALSRRAYSSVSRSSRSSTLGSNGIP
jgi:hypothetical protein